MPWVRAQIRDKNVFAQANEDGSLKTQNGAVEIRYKANDGRKYQARAVNLTVIDPKLLPDSTCGAAETVEREDKSAQAAANKAKAAAAITTKPIPTDAIIAYTDGACSGNPGPAGLGVVLITGSERAELSEYLGTGTNNVAELTAILRALERAKNSEKSLIIHTDSQYAIGVLTKGWKAKANTDLILRIRAALAARPGVQFVYVPGHAGVPLNERADELARLAISTRRTQTFATPTIAVSP